MAMGVVVWCRHWHHISPMGRPVAQAIRCATSIK